MQGNRDQLLKVVIEQIKLPLIHMARQAELASLTSTELDPASISNIADMTIKLIDSYLLSLATSDQIELGLEPVSLASVLQNTADNLKGVAKLYNCEVELELSGKYAPVMSNKNRLEAAFTMLGFSVIEAQTVRSNNKKVNRVYLSTYKTAGGVSGGIFSPQIEIDNDDLRRGLNAAGTARQGLPSVSHVSGAGIFIADAIFESLSSTLRAARYHKMNGLAATLIPSQQLRLIS